MLRESEKKINVGRIGNFAEILSVLVVILISYIAVSELQLMFFLLKRKACLSKLTRIAKSKQCL